MLVLHTADWHLGARFRDQRRGQEEDDALDQLVAVCRERAVDALILAGDVFDNANPAADDERRYYRTLARLTRDAGVATVVVVAGNHDSAGRLDSPRELASEMGVQVVGRFGRDDPAERVVVPLRDRRGDVAAVCCAVPYLRDGDLRLPDLGESALEIRQRYAVALAERYAAVRQAGRRLHPGLPLVVTGHCHVAGGTLGGEERSVTLGGLAALDAEALAGDAEYLALGHLHQPQAVGCEHWRYSGSLLPTGFDETGTDRELVLVRLQAAGSPATVERLPLRAFRGYRRLRGTVEEIERELETLPEPAGDAPSPWCEVVVTLAGPMPGLAPSWIDRARARGWSLVKVELERARGPASLGDAQSRTLGLAALDPLEVVSRLHHEEFDAAPDAELQAELEDLLASLAESPG